LKEAACTNNNFIILYVSAEFSLLQQ